MSHKLEWMRDGKTIYTLMHDSWRKGVETFRNRISFCVSCDISIPDGESIKIVDSIFRAVNAHDDLLASLKEYVEGYDGTRAERDARAKAAIAKAEGRK